jgi:hypothetical protein
MAELDAAATIHYYDEGIAPRPDPRAEGGQSFVPVRDLGFSAGGSLLMVMPVRTREA